MRVFCDLVQLQNFSRTAERYGISQSAVSQQIAQIETLHKCQLVNRKKRPLTLTGPGEMFYQACKDIIERYDRFSSDLALAARSVSKIKLAAIFSIGMHTLQPYVKKFMSAYPRVNLSVEYLDANRIYKGIVQGKLDIGVVAVPRMDRTIDVFPFENERLLLVCSPQHPLARESQVDLHKLQGLNFVSFGKDVPTRALIDDIFNQYRISVRTVMEFDNTETIKRAIEIDTGISILPEPTLALEIERGTLKAMPLKNATFYRPTAVIVRKDKTFTQAGRYLIELLHKRQDAV